MIEKVLKRHIFSTGESAEAEKYWLTTFQSSVTEDSVFSSTSAIASTYDYMSDLIKLVAF